MAFEESKHPRDKNGQFTSKGNESAGSGNTKKENTENHDSSAILNFFQKERAKSYAQRYEESPKDVYNAIEKRFNEYRDKGYKEPLDKAVEDVLDDMASNFGLPIETPDIEWDKIDTYSDLENALGRKPREHEYKKFIKPKIYQRYDEYKTKKMKDYDIKQELYDEFGYMDLINDVIKEKENKPLEIDADYERSYGEAPDPEEDPNGYKKYVDSYKKWKKGETSKEDEEKERKQAYKLFDLPF